MSRKPFCFYAVFLQIYTRAQENLKRESARSSRDVMIAAGVLFISLFVEQKTAVVCNF